MKILRNCQVILIIMMTLNLFSCREIEIKKDDSSVMLSNESKKKDEITRQNEFDLIPIDTSLSKSEILEVEKNIENWRQLGKLIKYSYPEMSYCGGALYGYYSNDELISIYSKFEGELGYKSKNILFQDGKIIQIKEQNYSAVWEKYSEAVVDGKFDNSKMTHTDTTLIINLGVDVEFKQEWNNGGKIIPSNKKTLNEFVKCISRMKKELDKEKILYDD